MNKFNINDRVKNKTLGIPFTGGICGILRSDVGIHMYSERAKRWNDIFPTWESKPVYFIRLDNPIKPLTYEEYIIQGDNSLSYNDIDSTLFVANPEDDLELI
jgi:hypothetical protein